MGGTYVVHTQPRSRYTEKRAVVIHHCHALHTRMHVVLACLHIHYKYTRATFVHARDYVVYVLYYFYSIIVQGVRDNGPETTSTGVFLSFDEIRIVQYEIIAVIVDEFLYSVVHFLNLPSLFPPRNRSQSQNTHTVCKVCDRVAVVNVIIPTKRKSI